MWKKLARREIFYPFQLSSVRLIRQLKMKRSAVFPGKSPKDVASAVCQMGSPQVVANAMFSEFSLSGLRSLQIENCAGSGVCVLSAARPNCLQDCCLSSLTSSFICFPCLQQLNSVGDLLRKYEASCVVVRNKRWVGVGLSKANSYGLHSCVQLLSVEVFLRNIKLSLPIWGCRLEMGQPTQKNSGACSLLLDWRRVA